MIGRITLLLLLVAMPVRAGASEGYYRFPALSGETLVFCAEGDLWVMKLDGGPARRLTTHPGEETHPAISPDGTTLAFVGAYEGSDEVYVMPLAGGRPTRLTYEGGSTRGGPEVTGWTPEGQVLYATSAYSTLPDVGLVRLDPRTGDAERVPLHQAADGTYDTSGKTLFFTRQAFQGSQAKRYQGGTAQSIWSFTEGEDEAVEVTGEHPGTSRSPMWVDGRVYFVSDRDGTLNLWSMKADGSEPTQHTFHQGWDVKTPAYSTGRIVYQLGADLRLYDTTSGSDRALAITLASDFDQTREKWVSEPLDYLTRTHLSPDGKRLVLTARGEVFVAPVGPGRFVNVTRKPGVRYRAARFMPDGKSLMALSDESSEVEWWRLPADGIGSAEPLTSDGKVLRYDGYPSPDGQWIVSDDHHQQLWLIHVATGRTWKVAQAASPGFSAQPAWSPDSHWFAYAQGEVNQLARIYLVQVEERRPVAVTSERYESFAPAWSTDGKWLYFLSERHFQSLVTAPWGRRQPDPFFDRQTKLYALALAPGSRFPFEPADELHDEEEGDPDTTEKEVEIVLEGLAERLYELPVAPGNYVDLAVNENRLFWREVETSFEASSNLVALDVGESGAQPATLVEDVESYELSGDGKKVLITQGGKESEGPRHFFVVDASSGAPLELERESEVDLSSWSFPLEPREQWRQMFVEAWRLHRDYFYDADMHGVDWSAMREKYLPLVDRVTTRAELSDVVAQMVSELSVLHTFVRGGDHREGPEKVEPAFLGAVTERTEEGYRIVHLYRTDPDLPDQLGPLARPGLDVDEGDVIVAVNGVSTLTRPPGASLRNQAGRQVRLSLKKPGQNETRDVIVVPVDGERARDLRYDEWERTRRLTVEEKSDGTIGYVHLRAMGPRDIADWQREFYPVFDRQGLIVDVRHNRGGNVDSWILGKLLRRAWMYWQGRWGEPYWNMQQAFRGHMAVIVDEWTRSDGEAFAEGFRRLGLGPVIGTRTWGGEVWLTSSNVLVDNGIATAAEFGVYGPEGVWLIEGHGVEPDVTVDNLPHATFEGGDAQLDAAIEHLLGQIREDPRPVPPVPPYPDKSFN